MDVPGGGQGRSRLPRRVLLRLEIGMWQGMVNNVEMRFYFLLVRAALFSKLDRRMTTPLQLC